MATLEEKRKALEKKFVEARPPLAYAKLSGRAGDDSPFEMLVTTLPVELGRGPLSTTPGARISLGEQKALSRQHARIQWNQDKSCFELVCLGKNGVYAAGSFVAKDATVELPSKMPIKIGPARLYFLAAVRSTCSTMSGGKMMQKAFEKAAAKGKLAAPGAGLSVDDLVAQIMDMFPKSEHELGGLDNLRSFISEYIVEDPTFEPIAGTSPVQYRMNASASATATTTAATGSAASKADDNEAARKRQKTQ